MRLIDADKLNFLEQHYNKSQMKAILDFLDAQPTAYDVDKVVEQLEEEKELAYADFDRYVEEVDPCLDSEYDDYFHKGIGRAIKIVKAGGFCSKEKGSEDIMRIGKMDQEYFEVINNIFDNPELSESEG